YTFPSTLESNNIMGVKQYIKDMHRSLIALAKVDTLKLNRTAIRQLVEQ
ncbi:12901_t:CDS:1, partial [Funneliformis geosporum]